MALRHDHHLVRVVVHIYYHAHRCRVLLHRLVTQPARPAPFNINLLDWVLVVTAILLVDVSVHYKSHTHIIIREHP